MIFIDNSSSADVPVGSMGMVTVYMPSEVGCIMLLMPSSLWTEGCRGQFAVTYLFSLLFITTNDTDYLGSEEVYFTYTLEVQGLNGAVPSQGPLQEADDGVYVG